MSTESIHFASPRERRASDRRSISLRARVRLPDQSVLEAHTIDVSKSGLGLFSPRQLHMDQDCHVSIDLCVCGEQMKLELIGRVCYSTESSAGRFRTGMRFVGLESGAAMLLARLLS